MEIKTKFNLGDVVFVLNNNNIIEGYIWDIRTINRKNYYEEFYMIINKKTGLGVGTNSIEHPEYGDYINSDKIYKSIKDVILNNQNILDDLLTEIKHMKEDNNKLLLSIFNLQATYELYKSLLNIK